ncbi:MAG: TonB-dependent receptor plug domain-containing protein [Bacteroidota bacterium]|nr:TonB-dependent receptor plug domain-containing protein [Bacteroidota bacterium]
MNQDKRSTWKSLDKSVFVILLLLLTTLNLEAQKLTDTISIEEVPVFGRKMIEEAGTMTTHIDTLVLQMLKTQTISELLSSYSPVFIKSYGRGSTATASFRGTAPSHTQVYWNGMKLNSPMRGDVDFSLFPVHFIDDLSLQHGGSSLKSGSGALGGSVLINNKPDWTDRFSVRYVQTIESFSTHKEYLNLGFGNGKIQFKTRVFSDRSKNDFSYFNYGVLPMHEDVQKNAEYSKSGLLQEVYSRFKNQSVSAKLWAYQSDRNLPQLMSFEGDIRKETQKDQNLRAVLSWKYFKEKSKVEWMAGLNMNRLNYFRSSTEANFVNFDSQSKEQSFTNQFNYDWTPKETLSFNWSLNTTYNTVSVFDHAQKTGYDQDQLAFSLLNSAHIMLLPQWAISFVFRSEIYDDRLISFIPSFGTEYWLDKKQLSSFKLNLSRNYHQPGLNDLYWLPGGNPNLKPEDGFSGDLAFAYKGQEGSATFSGQVTGFASLIDNWIVWQPSASGAYFWEANNLRKVFARGAEIQVSGQLKTANVMWFSLRGNYSYSATSNIDAVPSVDESRGKQLIYIPKHKANMFAEADFKAYYMKLNVPFTGKRYTSSNNIESDYEKVLNPYWLLNLTAGKKFDWKRLQADLSLNVENLTNKDYMAVLWRPMPGRYYSLTVQIQFRK